MQRSHRQVNLRRQTHTKAAAVRACILSTSFNTVVMLSAQERSRDLAVVYFYCCSKNCQSLSIHMLRTDASTRFPLNITHIPLGKPLVTAIHRLIETVTCDEFGGLQFILQSNLLPGMNCTVSWTSGISSASSFSDLITSSLWNRDNIWQRNKGKLDCFI